MRRAAVNHCVGIALQYLLHSEYSCKSILGEYQPFKSTVFANREKIEYYTKLSMEKSLNLTSVKGVMLYPLEVIFTLLYKRF
ncbi:hypothetical protein NIES2100_68190 [Calothrix sp. NIES-2100]|nr:hypothetical protein NIES2100_68190 [Calothrix sp. NIES-2100]